MIHAVSARLTSSTRPQSHPFPRYFSAIRPAGPVGERLLDQVSDWGFALRPHAALHVTLSFAGPLDAARARRLVMLLDQIVCRPLVLEVEGAGVAKAGAGGRLQGYVAVKAQGDLARLAEACSAATSKAGGLAATFAYRPHITLATLHDDEAARRWIEGPASKVTDCFDAASFDLLASHPTRAASPYRRVRTFELSTQARRDRQATS